MIIKDSISIVSQLIFSNQADFINLMKGSCQAVFANPFYWLL
jgi:hypothetical protein